MENGLGLIDCLHRWFCLSTGNIIASTAAAISTSEDFKTVNTLTAMPRSCKCFLSSVIFILLKSLFNSNLLRQVEPGTVANMAAR